VNKNHILGFAGNVQYNVATRVKKTRNVTLLKIMAS
jgi:hypothetical protein